MSVLRHEVEASTGDIVFDGRISLSDLRAVELTDAERAAFGFPAATASDFLKKSFIVFAAMERMAADDVR